MKYMNYLINGRPVRPEQLGVIALPSAILAVIFIAAMLPGALMVDCLRYLKLRYLLFKFKQRNLNYIKSVLRSLEHPESKELINLLIAA
jgi:hypothetical protein